MILVIGGYAAGKRDWVHAHLGYLEEDFSRDLDDSRPVLYDLQALDVTDAAQLSAKAVVICDEIGCGLVPMDPGERARREQVGRLCIALAKEAEAVVRVVCGVGTVIKGTLNR